MCIVLSEFNELCNDYDYVSLFSQSETINDLFLFILITIITIIVIIIIVILRYLAVESKGVITVHSVESCYRIPHAYSAGNAFFFL